MVALVHPVLKCINMFVKVFCPQVTVSFTFNAKWSTIIL